MSIPPFLTSGASSRAHHALIVSLNECNSVQEENAVAQKEIRRVKDVFHSKPSMGKISENLIILLHCHMVFDEPADIEWALVPALQLAEGGKTLKERRIGYLYLCERLPPGHELALMLINTIRKDLSSSNPQEILLALNTIVHLPSSELLPAVQPLLVSKSLLRHQIPAIRHKTLVALSALYWADDKDLSRTVGPKTFPLSLGKLVKMMNKETDASVVGVTLRLMRRTIVDKVHAIKDDEERMYLVESVIAQGKRSHVGTAVLLNIVKALQVLVKPDHGSCELAVPWLSSVVKSKRHGSTMLLECCDFATRYPEQSEGLLIPTIIKRISALLAPPTSTSSSTALSIPRANDHVLALRCLTILTPTSWDGLLGDSEMRTIMEGLNSFDDTIRLATLRLLLRMSPELLDAAYNNHLNSMQTSSNLALPLGLPDGLDTSAKLRIGQEETAMRALEVVRMEMAAMEYDSEAGEHMAKGVLGICATIGAVQEEGGVWDRGLRIIIDDVKAGWANPSFREAFTRGLLSTSSSSEQTTAVLRAMTFAEYGNFEQGVSFTAINVLLSGIGSYPASVQELLLVSAVGIHSRSAAAMSRQEQSILSQVLDQVRKEASVYMQKRCSQIERILSDPDLLARVDKETKSRSLGDLLEAIVRLAKPPKTASSSISPPSTSRSLASSALRYGAYAPPASNSASRSTSESRSTVSPLPSAKRVGSPRAMSAGEYALFSADEQEISEASALLDEDGIDNLVGLSLSGGQRPVSQRRISDPFDNDDDQPSTPRLP